MASPALDLRVNPAEETIHARRAFPAHGREFEWHNRRLSRDGLSCEIMASE
jgi:hypothetical protein